MMIASAAASSTARVLADGNAVVYGAQAVAGPAPLPPPPPSAAPSFGPGPAPATVTAAPAPAPPPLSQPRCAPAGEPSDSVTRLSSTYVCITLIASATNASSSAAGTTLRAVFTPFVDIFSLVQVAGSFKRFSSGGGAVTVSASSLGSATADAKIWLSADGSQVFPTQTVIIAVSSAGNVQAAAFDEGCFGCGGARGGACAANTLAAEGGGHVSCYVPRVDCVDTPQPGNPHANTCDLKVFFAWAGEDAQGAYMTSTSQRLSRFSAWPLQAAQLWASVTSFASRTVQGALPALQQQLPPPPPPPPPTA